MGVLSLIMLLIPFLLQTINPFQSELVQNDHEIHYLLESNIHHANNRSTLSGCNAYQQQQEEDLKFWIQQLNGISNEFMNATLQNYDDVMFYQIIHHKLYRSRTIVCHFPVRCQGVEYFLKRAAPYVSDTEFFINIKDLPMVSRQHRGVLLKSSPSSSSSSSSPSPSSSSSLPPPIFSFSKNRLTHLDILYPAWSFWSGGPAIWPIYPQGIGLWNEMRENIMKTSNDWPWSMKRKQLFFRGSRTDSERDLLIELSWKYPSLINATYTKNQAWRSKLDTLNREPALVVSLTDHCQYAYLVNLKGVAASFRLRHLFLCNSLVFHIASTQSLETSWPSVDEDDWIEFFYSALIPWYHYVPLPSTSHQLFQQRLLETLIFFQTHDHLAELIALQGREFIEHNLRQQDVECYWRRLLRKYSKLLNYRPSLRENFMEVV